MFCFLKNWKTKNRKLLEMIMATVEEIKQVLTEVKDNNTEVSGKVDLVITKLSDLQNAGNGATQEQLGEILALANEVKSGVQGTEDKLDAAATTA